MVLADALFPSPIFRRATRLNLLQRSDNLRLCVPVSAHPSYLFLRPNRIPNWMDSGGQVIPAKVNKHSRTVTPTTSRRSQRVSGLLNWDYLYDRIVAFDS